MSQTTRKLFFYFNWPLFLSILVLLCIGLLNLYSATASRTGEVSPYFYSQVQWALIGLGVFCFSFCFHYRHLNTFALPFYGLCLLLLIAVFFLGSAAGGQQNWLVLGPLRIQPSELSKLAVVLLLAHYYAKHPEQDWSSLKSQWVPTLIWGVPLALILLEKDLGAAIFFVLIGVSFFFLTGLKKRYLLGGLVLMAMLGALGYQFFLKDYQRARIHTFLSPEKDPRGKGYHLLQSKIAVGSGRLSGKGYLAGDLNKLKFLPERHTDFVFPVLAEEWGFLGSVFTLVSFGAFFILLFQAAGKVQDPFGSLLTAGVACWLFWQWGLNLAGVLGLAPLAGVTLPFLSYGGSALLTNLLALGLVMNVYMRRYVF